MLYRDNRAKADAYIGYVMAASTLGRGLGGLSTLFFPEDLFLPLIPAASLNVIALFAAYKFVLEPNSDGVQDEEDVNDDSPKSLQMRAFINITFGAILDYIGSLAIAPIGLSPIMYETFYLNFIENGLNPVMTVDQVSIGVGVYNVLYSMQ